jgi:hypothetical protein
MPKHKFVPDETLCRSELFRLGYFHSGFDGDAEWKDVKALKRSNAKYKRAIRDYQAMAELQQDEDLGPVTNDSLRFLINSRGHRRMCSCPDIEPVVAFGKRRSGITGGGTVKWPDSKKPIKFGRNFSSISGLNAGQVDTAWRDGLKNWNDSCGVQLVESDYDEAHVKQFTQGLSGGTLAIALLSLGSRGIGRHWQKYDTSNRRWSVNMLKAVLIHETGHTMGYSHSNSGVSIMRPYMDPDVNVLQNADKKRIQKDYGTPLEVPEVPEVPLPPPGSGNIDGFVTIGNVSLTISSGNGSFIFPEEGF